MLPHVRVSVQFSSIGACVLRVPPDQRPLQGGIQIFYPIATGQTMTKTHPQPLQGE